MHCRLLAISLLHPFTCCAVVCRVSRKVLRAVHRRLHLVQRYRMLGTCWPERLQFCQLKPLICFLALQHFCACSFQTQPNHASFALLLCQKQLHNTLERGCVASLMPAGGFCVPTHFMYGPVHQAAFNMCPLACSCSILPPVLPQDRCAPSIA